MGVQILTPAWVLAFILSAWWKSQGRPPQTALAHVARSSVKAGHHTDRHADDYKPILSDCDPYGYFME